MKQFTFLFSFLIIGCTSQHKGQISSAKELNSDTIKTQSKIDQSNFENLIDTILEKNNPTALDLSKHQVFLDTTRNSKFYKNLENWTPSKFDIQSISEYLTDINTSFTPEKIKLEQFPTRFITLRKLNGNFVLYDRCDGIDPRFEIQETAFCFYGPLESDAESIEKMIALDTKKIQLQLRTIAAKSPNQKSTLTIEKINDSIYKLTYKNQSYDWFDYVTIIENISKFDLVVNNCPTMKMLEYNGFDKEVK